jgi:hypothetical protein
MIRKLNVATLLAACAVASIFAMSPQSAEAQIYDVGWTVNPGTKLNLAVTMPFGLGTKNTNVNLTGTLDSTINTTADTLQINSADIDFSNFSLSYSIIIAGVKLTGTGIGLAWESDPLPYTGTLLNLGGSDLTMNSGTLLAVGSGLASSVNENINLTTSPVEFEAPNPTNSTLNIGNLALPVPTGTTWSIPIALNEVLDLDGNSVTVVLNGTINLTAVSSVEVVPEPSSVLLAGTAALGLTWAGRKRFKKAKR